MVAMVAGAVRLGLRVTKGRGRPGRSLRGEEHDSAHQVAGAPTLVGGDRGDEVQHGARGDEGSQVLHSVLRRASQVL